MRRQAQGQMVRWVSRTAAVAAGAAALLVTGCAHNRPAQPGLLGARTVVPAPFVEPAAGTVGTALPPEPAFTGTTVVPAGTTLDENLVMQPVDEVDDAKPTRGGQGKSVSAPRADSERQTYTVRKGDSLWLIARRYGVTVAELTAENSIPESKVLKVGQTITLPHGARLRDVSETRHATPKHTAAAAPSKPKNAAPSKSTAGTTKSAASASGSSRKTSAKEPIPADGMYTIKSGDNPWDLARKFGVKHEELMQWNNLKSDTVLQVGQKIRLRSGAAESTATTAAAPTAAKSAPAPVTAPAPGTVLPEAPLVPPAAATVPDALGPDAPAATAPGATPATGAAAATGTPGTAAPAVPAGALDLPKKLSHSVTEGETLQIIAEMYGTTVDAIKKENPTIKADADLQPNLKLMVPYR